MDPHAISKLTNVPLAQPGFDALGLSAPVIVQANPQGKWETQKPDKLDEERLKAVVQHLVNSKTLSGASSYCCQCALENKNAGLQSHYVPVIMMPIYPADQCPFDLEGHIQKAKGLGEKQRKKPKKTEELAGRSNDKDKNTKPKKRGFVMQRLTDFDLLSQW